MDKQVETTYEKRLRRRYNLRDNDSFAVLLAAQDVALPVTDEPQPVQQQELQPA